MYKIDNIFQRSDSHKKGANQYTKHSLANWGWGWWYRSDPYRVLDELPNGIRQIAIPFSSQNSPENSKSAPNMLTPPSELFSDIIPPEGVALAAKLEQIATKQFVQQFYELYMAPTGLKEVYNRLGSIAGNISNVHNLYPNGLKGVISGDTRGSWRTSTNFSFTVDEGLGTKPAQYTSFGFPPFIEHDVVDANNLLAISQNDNENIRDDSFDMTNILYRRNQATLRFPAFKQVNDNIHTLQVLLNRCFGIESTYINEWDLSMYMQEGLCSFVEKVDQDGNTIRMPQFVTTLTYGLLDDAPTEFLVKRGKAATPNTVDLDLVSTFASVNCAVSTRYGLDNQPLGEQANKTIYTISKYPYSAYWYPNDSGSRKDSLNVSNYISDFFSYEENGLAFNENRPYSRNYTPKIFHGGNLARSTKRFLQLLNYNDDKYAILSGWNSTDVNGSNYLRDADTTNESTKSNAYSYLPFWKQFYTTANDGMSEVDLYMQEILASDKDCSFINAAFNVIKLTTDANDAFLKVIEKAARSEYERVHGPLGEEDDFNKVTPKKYGSGPEYGNIKIGFGKFKIEIPKTKLLNMFFNRDKITSKAKAAADVSGDINSSANGGAGSNRKNNVSPADAMKTATPTKSLSAPKTVIGPDGKEIVVEEFTPTAGDEICSKKIVGDGIAEYSPFLYGGPHGKYFSPLTLEGYTQISNQNLANVPTVDSFSMFEGNTNRNGIRGFEFSKNYKLNGSYIDHTIALTPNEREALTKGTSDFGVKNMKPDTRHIMPYTSNWYTREYYTDWNLYLTIRIRFWFFKWFSFTIRIPRWWYYKAARTVNGRYRNWIGFPRDYGTGYYSARSHTTRVEYHVSAQTDWWYQDFRLLPTNGWTADFKPWYFWNLSTILAHFKDDQWRQRRPTSYYVDENNNIVYTWKPSDWHINDRCLKWMIVPSNIGGGPVCGDVENSGWLHWSSYSSPGTTWYNQLRNLWCSGTRECSVTLPIKDTSNRILQLLCGIVRIFRSKSLTYVWRLRLHWGISWRRGWWWWDWFGWWYPYYYYYYVWHLETAYQDTYNAYFYPDKVQWILPTDVLLNQEAQYNENQRNKNSSNIIERWCTDGLDERQNQANIKRFTHLSSTERWSPALFPFTEEFIQKYGYYEPYTPIPGVSYHHSQYMRGFKVLHSKGLYWGDLMESYRNTGSILSTVAVGSHIQTWNGQTTTTDEAAGVRYQDKTWRRIFRWFFGRWYTISSRFDHTRNVTWYADYPIFTATQKAKQWELTGIVDRCQAWPAIQEYQTTGLQPWMTWYKPEHTIDVFIDTAIQQIAWLKQLRDYADLFITDKLIFEIYRKSVDNKAQAIIEYNYNGDSKNGQNYIASGGWTESFTEDINYHDALAIVRRAFKTEDPNRNTIRDLTDRRIYRLQALLEYAKTCKRYFNSSPTYWLHEFINLVTNTKSYLDCAITAGSSAENKIFNSSGSYNRNILFEISNSTTYDLVSNPASLLWAYLNVLYHVRKYWVCMRFNKRAGSYWQLRGLERVLTFMLAGSTGEDSPLSPNKSISQGTPLELKAKPIQYVQPRESFSKQASDLNNLNEVYTQAVYCKVDYLGTPTPEASSKWNATEKTYDGVSIVYVNEAYKFAFKPVDGLYYVMSNTITQSIVELTNNLKTTLDAIYTKDYKVTGNDIAQIIQEINKPELREIILENKALYRTEDEIKKEPRASIKNKNTKMFVDFLNNLAEYKQVTFVDQIKKLLYPIYIRWQPEHVWTGIQENEGSWKIDEWQKQDSFGKERKVLDLYGFEHVSTDAISAGITFDVVASMNPETLLSSPGSLRNSSLLEILCSCADTIDLWRVEIPKELNIPVQLLENKPKLVPAYIIDSKLNGLTSKEMKPSAKSVLVGAASNSILPVVESSENFLTLTSLAALGQFNSVSAAGESLTKS